MENKDINKEELPKENAKENAEELTDEQLEDVVGGGHGPRIFMAENSKADLNKAR